MQIKQALAHRLRYALAALPVAFLSCAPSAQAAEGGLGLRAGMGSEAYRAEVFYQTEPFWSYELGGNWGKLTLDGEFGVAYWKARHNDESGNAWQFTATPMLRWWMTPTFYLEGGVGPSVFSTTHVAGKQISTAFQFADQIGIGFRPSRSHDISLRFAHYSNASIKRPNPGLNSLQLNYVYRF